MSPGEPATALGDPDVRRLPAPQHPECPPRPARRPAVGRRPGVAEALALVDLAAALAAVLAATVAAGGGAHLAGGRLVLVALAFAVAEAVAGYRPRARICLRAADEAGRILRAVAVGFPVLVLWAPAAAALRAALAAVAALLAARALAYAAVRAAHRRGRLVEATVVVGAGEMGVRVAETLVSHPELGLAPVGFVDAVWPPDPLPLPVLGGVGELVEIVCRRNVRRVVACFPVERDRDVAPFLRAVRDLPVDVCLVPRMHDLATAVPRSSLDELWGIPLLPLRRGGTAPAARAVKRLLDAVLAALALVVAAPVLLVLAVLVRLACGAPVLFRQVRVTGDGRQAAVLKLRTLPAQDDPDRSWGIAGECSRLGRFLRDTHLDELPQLWNVLRGDMSLVGPRPERPFFAERFSAEIDGYANRTRMRAGLTGWAQVHGLYGDTPLAERARFDNAYIESWSPWTDLVVLARTLVAPLKGRRGGGR